MKKQVSSFIKICLSWRLSRTTKAMPICATYVHKESRIQVHHTMAVLSEKSDFILVTSYCDCEEAKLFCVILEGPTFLPVYHITTGLSGLKENIPEGFNPLVDYFEATYILGTYRKIQRPAGPDCIVPPLRIRKVPALYLPELWSANTQKMCGDWAHNNLCDSWNRGFSTLLGTSHTPFHLESAGTHQDHANI